MDERKTEQLDALFDGFARAAEPGGAIAISMSQRAVYRRAFGMSNLAAGAANRVSTPMPVGSIAKQFTAAAILLLQEDGLLTCRETVGKWLPELSPDHHQITIEQLLRHQSGVRCYLDHWMFHGYRTLSAGLPWAIQMRQQGLNFEPGARTAYSNGAYLLLSAIVERAGGRPFAEFISQRLLSPAGMYSSLIAAESESEPGTASPYVQDAVTGDWSVAPRLTQEASGDGGLISTVDDLIRWAWFLRHSDSPVNLRALTAPDLERAEGPSDYRYGVITQTWRGVDLVLHSGGMPGASSVLVMLADQDIDVAIQFNRSSSAMQHAFKALEIILANELEDAVEVPRAHEFKDILGTYWAEDSRFLFTLADMAGELGLGIFGDRPFPLEGWRGEFETLPFWADAGASQIRFRRGEAPRSLDYFDGRRWIPARQIRQTSETPEQLVLRTRGRFGSREAGVELELTLRDGQFLVQFDGEAGRSCYPAEIIADDLLRFWPPMFPAGKLAHVKREAGYATAIIVSTPRTSAIEFKRIE